MWKQCECTEMCLCMNTPWSVHQERSNTLYQTHAYLRLLYVTAILKHQKKLVSFIQPRKRSLHIIQWWDVLTLRSACISQCAACEWALALFRNNHRACVSKRNTLELIIHWKRNVSIYSLHHLLCNQLVVLFYISPLLDWLLEWIRLLDHWTENFLGV